MLAREEVCYRTFCEDVDIVHAFSRLSTEAQSKAGERTMRPGGNIQNTKAAYLQGDRIIRLGRSLSTSHCTKEVLIAQGHLAREEDAEFERRQAAAQARKSPKKQKGGKGSNDFLTSSEAAGKGKVAELAQKSKAQVNAFTSGAGQESAHTQPVQQDVVMFDEELPRVDIHSSVSSKLNWILREVCSHFVNARVRPPIS